MSFKYYFDIIISGGKGCQILDNVLSKGNILAKFGLKKCRYICIILLQTYITLSSLML